MSYRIGKRFTFCASHQLEELPEGHPCRRLHGHTYQVEVVLAANTLNEAGMVIDFHQVKQWVEPLLESQFDTSPPQRLATATYGRANRANNLRLSASAFASTYPLRGG